MRETKKKSRSWIGITALLTFLALWLGLVCYSIATEPPPGAASPQALREDTRKAVREKDADALQNLFDKDTVVDEYAERYLKELRGDRVRDVDAVTQAQGRGTYLMLHGAGEDPVCTSWRTVRKDGRWMLDGTAPTRAVCDG
ncbi:hypothetical protein [Streptomyces sp. bgisy100]|uniref:hypothetical protein n=1 Tax=Streptomyces sp. bgisy100 TaxID=3413783 RepID=UPI003D717A3D